MNKYLEKYNKLEKQLNSEFNESGYEVFKKMETAVEVECILDNYEEFDCFDLSSEQEEMLIKICYDVYMDSETDVGIFNLAKAVLFTMEEYGTYENFIEKYKNSWEEILDKICWRL